MSGRVGLPHGLGRAHTKEPRGWVPRTFLLLERRMENGEPPEAWEHFPGNPSGGLHFSW